MKFTTFYKIVFLLFVGIVFVLLLCCNRSYSQTVSDNEQHHYHDYNLYNLGDSLKDSGMVRFFTVTASDMVKCRGLIVSVIQGVLGSVG
jgi:hypothetical protein